jgi:hypothetical protein
VVPGNRGWRHTVIDVPGFGLLRPDWLGFGCMRRLPALLSLSGTHHAFCAAQQIVQADAASWLLGFVQGHAMIGFGQPAVAARLNSGVRPLGTEMIVFSQMDRRGTATMFLLGIPSFITALLAGIASAHLFPGAFLATAFGSFFVFSFAYSKALVAFHRLSPRRPIWLFVALVLLVQMLVLAATIYAVAA